MKKPKTTKPNMHPSVAAGIPQGKLNMFEPPPSPARRVVFVHHAYKRMTEPQLRAALTAVPADDPRLTAFQQLIDEEIGAAIMETTARHITAEQRASAAALAELKGRLEELRK